MKGRTWRGEEPARISVPSHLGHQGQTRRSVAHGHSRKSLGRVHVCGTEEHCRPHWGKEESWPCCQQNLGSLPALRNIHTFMYLPHGSAVRQHMCCGCTMQSEKSTRQEKCCCGEVAQAMVPGVRVAARDAPLLPGRGEVCTQLPFCKGKSLITRCLGSSGLHFLTLISLLLACGLVLFFAERKY